MEDKNKVSNGSVNWLLFFNIVLYVLITEFVIIVNSYISFDVPDAYTTRIIVQLFAILLPLFLFSCSKKLNIKSFYRVHRLGLKNIIYIAILGVCSQFIGAILKMFVKFVFVMFKIPYSVSSQIVLFPQKLEEIILPVIAFVVLPAVAEELLFRGLVLRSYEKSGTRSAIMISALLFGLLHLNISSMLATVFMGLLLAYVVIKTDSLFAGIVLHLVNNGTALFMALTQISTTVMYALIFVAVIVFVLCLLMFNKHNISFKHIPQRRSISTEITRTLFTLPILLSIIAFIIIQLYIFNIF